MPYMSKLRKAQLRKAAFVWLGGFVFVAVFFLPSAQADYPTYSNSVNSFNRSQSTGASGWKLAPAVVPQAIKRKTVPVLEKEPPPERRSTFGNFGIQPASPKKEFGSGAEPEPPSGDVEQPKEASAEGAQETSGSSGSSGFKLRAGITHSEVLTPLPPAQRPGRVYKANAFVAGGARAKQFKIPDWIAGIWQRSEAKEIARTQLPSGKQMKPVGSQVARVKDVFGTYRDQNGQVWQTFNPVKASGQIDRGPNMDYHRVHGYDLVITGPKSLVIEVQASHTLVNKANRQIQRVYQDEELNSYTLLPDGKLKTDSSVKVFDMDGKPFLLTRSVSTEIRVPPKNWPPRANSPVRGN